MINSKKRNFSAVVLSAFFLIAPLFLTQPAVFAGDSGCQSGRLTHQYDNYGRPENAKETAKKNAKQQEQFAAAEMKNAENQPPSASGSVGGDSSVRSSFSYFASVFFLLGGIWLLACLLKARLKNRFAPKSAPTAKIWKIAFNPSFALSAFALLFAATIIGSALTSPTKTTAQNKKKTERPSVKPEMPTAPTAPTEIANQRVFKSAQQIGGDGVTQIGTPVFDALGNRYVRGTFSGTLTIGTTTLTASYDLDMFIAKYDASGNPLWARQGTGEISAPSNGLAVEGATSLALDEANGVFYVSGSFVRKFTLQGGSNPPITLTDLGGAGYNYEAFLAKYDTEGNLIWARGGNSGSQKNADNNETGQNTINKIVLDGNGKPYVAGFISGNTFLGASISNFFCSDGQQCSLHGKSDIIVAAIDPANGAPTEMSVIGGTGDDNGLDLAIDFSIPSAPPKLYLVANFSSPSIALPLPLGSTNYSNPNGAIQSFIIKLEVNAAQHFIRADWHKVFQSTGTMGVNQIVINPQYGNLYISGYFTGFFQSTSSTGMEHTYINDRTGTGETALAGFYSGVDPSDGRLFGFTEMPGVATGIALNPTNGQVGVVGTFYDTGTFDAGGGDVLPLDSFGGSDTFVAMFSNGVALSWAKTVSGTGDNGLVAAGNPSADDGLTKNYYSPLSVAFSNDRLFVSGDFHDTIALDCLTLKAPGGTLYSYIGELSGENETTNCRVWTNTASNAQLRGWYDHQLWNNGIVPRTGDSVFVPFTKGAVSAPIYNPSRFDPNSNVPLSKVTVGGGQTLELEEEMTINDQLDLLGGNLDTKTKKLKLGAFADTYTIQDGRVLGTVEKLFFGQVDSFTFPVGTANGYSPVTLSNVNAGKGGTFAVTAYQGAYPNMANNLPVGRANRWWNLTNGGLISTDITFKYLPGDITLGQENQYRAYRIPTGGGNAVLVNSTIDTTAKTVSTTNVSQFSDWTLAQPLAPTAAYVPVGGRVLTANGQGVSQVRVSLTDSAGNIRTATTNTFGYYTFQNVAVGASYVIQAAHKRYEFEQPTQILSVTDGRDDVNFTVLSNR